MKIVIAIGVILAACLFVSPSKAEGPILYASTGMIQTEHGMLSIEVIHTGDAGAALNAVGAGQVEAYATYGFKQDSPLGFHYNSRYRPVQESYVRAGVESWNEFSSFSATITGTTTRTARNCDRLPNDGMSVIDWGNVSNGSTNRIVAVACWWNPGECDIRIDPWAIPGLEAQWYQGIIAHEVGHCAGIGHSEDPGALMYPFISVTTPQADDITGIRSLYGFRYWFWR